MRGGTGYLEAETGSGGSDWDNPGGGGDGSDWLLAGMGMGVVTGNMEKRLAPGCWRYLILFGGGGGEF